MKGVLPPKYNYIAESKSVMQRIKTAYDRAVASIDLPVGQTRYIHIHWKQIYCFVRAIVFVVFIVYCYRLEVVTLPDLTAQVSPNTTFPGDYYDPSLDFLAGSVSNVYNYNN